MYAWIISIGNELLIGEVPNTNATWLARKLTLLGYMVRKIIIIPDDEEEIIKTFREAVNEAKITISTGGLGPTFDDKTSECLAKAFDSKWVVNQDAYEEIKKKFQEVGMKLTPARVKMAKMPEGAESLHNSVGIAPGIFLKINNKIIVALPGVPKEMKAIFEETLEKILGEIGPHKYYEEKNMRVVGMPESSAAKYIVKIMKKYRNIYVKSHPRGHETKGPIVDIHIDIYAKDEVEGEKILNSALNELARMLKKAGASIELLE